MSPLPSAAGSKGSEETFNNRLRVLIATGASMGHLSPALSFAENLLLKDPRAEIAFVSSRRGAIEAVLKASRYSFYYLSICPFSFSFLKFFKALYCMIKSFFETFFIIETFRPDIVAGFGSYASFPVLLEAALFKKHTFIHEQNVSLGRANKFLSPFVDKVALSFKETARFPKCVCTGNPLRASLVAEDKEKARDFFKLEDKFTLLIVGGSQGSHMINTEFKNSLPLLEERYQDFQYIHITGRNDYFDLKKSCNYTKITHCVLDFLSEMHLAYSLADLVVSRAGAGTITELAYFRKAAILIPYPYARSHQIENARLLMKEDAAIVIEEKRLEGALLCRSIITLMDSDESRHRLERNIQKFTHPDAGIKLAELALSFEK